MPVVYILSFPGSSAGKESACNAGDLGSIQEDPLKKGKATHSSMAWRILWSPWGCKESDMSEHSLVPDNK